MKLKNFFSLLVILFLFVSCSKEVIKKSTINEKSLDLQVIEAYEEGKNALEEGDVYREFLSRAYDEYEDGDKEEDLNQCHGAS